MFIEYKTFAIFKVSHLILLLSLDSAEVAKVSAPSKCRSLIGEEIILQFALLEMMAFALLNISIGRVLA